MILFAALVSFAVSHAQDLARGKYLSRAASCRECHTVPGQPDFAGGAALVTPFGKFFPPNITPDPATGIGGWTEQDFQRALRFGISPQHKIYYPTFPYRAFTKMTDEDMRSLYAHLRAQPPVVRQNRAHELEAPFGQRWLLYFWQFLFFRDPGKNALTNIKTAIGPFQPDPAQSEEWNRGAYLVEAVLHCAECHTPRNALGAPIANQWMAGSDLVFSGRSPPNLTSDPATGLRWTREEWLDFLASGVDPEGKTPVAEMALAVRAASTLIREDRKAVVQYLMSLPPVRRANREVQ